MGSPFILRTRHRLDGFGILSRLYYHPSHRRPLFLLSISNARPRWRTASRSCSALLAKNGDAMKKIIKADKGFTIFAPNEVAFVSLGEKRRSQLEDIRNAEVRAGVWFARLTQLVHLSGFRVNTTNNVTLHLLLCYRFQKRLD
jgi:hypothetical protein